MHSIEARHTRHLVIRLDQGEELPDALLRALETAGARSAWVTAVGALEAADLAVYDRETRRYTTARRVDGPLEIASLSGFAAVQDGKTTLRLAASLTREAEGGLGVHGGQLAWARTAWVEASVVVLEDVALTRTHDERTGLSLLGGTSTSAAALAAPAPPLPVLPAGEPAPPVTRPDPAPPAAALITPPPAIDRVPVAADYNAPAPEGPRPVRGRAREEPESYPEPGDHVMHFHFGECTVIESDGDRIRLRQERDGRVREVALTMLRIEPPTVDASGTRHFLLSRKN